MVISPQPLQVGHLHPNPRWRMAAHRHAFHELIVPVCGKMTVWTDGSELHVEAGDVLIYPAGLEHEEQADPSEPIESFFVPFERPGFAGMGVLRKNDHGGRMRQLVRWLHADQSVPGTQAAAERDALFVALLARFFRDDQPTECELAQRVRAFVRSHLGEALTLDQLAREAGLSRSYFVRAYQRLTGYSPMQDVRRIRLEYARDLVMTTRTPLKAVAELAGLGSPYALSRLFHRAFGVPPGTLRRSQ